MFKPWRFSLTIQRWWYLQYVRFFYNFKVTAILSYSMVIWDLYVCFVLFGTVITSSKEGKLAAVLATYMCVSFVVSHFISLYFNVIFELWHSLEFFYFFFFYKLYTKHHANTDAKMNAIALLYLIQVRHHIYLVRTFLHKKNPKYLKSR